MVSIRQRLWSISRSVFAVVTDADGSFAVAQTSVTINPDTTPPRVVGVEEDVCLWPPDHRRVLFEPSELGLTVIDECDPSPQIQLLSGSSSQPDNGLGDGDTTGDIAVGTDAVCVRAERQGGDRGGRTYTITARARDAAGNVSAAVGAAVRVPHSMPLPADCHRLDGERVSESDPRCVSPSVPVAADVLSRAVRLERGSAGCRVGDRSGAVTFVLVFLMALARRRRP